MVRVGPNPGVSVLMPVRNAASTVAKAVRGILEQSLTDFELLLLENGSTDETPGILRDLSGTDSRIRLLALRRAGLVRALNLGLQEARAPFIARMDADDASHPRRLELQLRHLREHPQTGLVSCLVRHAGDSKSQAGYAAYVDWVNTQVTHEQITLNRFVESPLAHPSVIFRREVADAFGGWREGSFPEDYELWLRWLEAGVRMEKVPEVLFEWGDPPDRLSRTDPRYSPRAFFACKAAYLARWLQQPPAAGRELLLWGAGRETRRRLRPLLKAGIRPAAWVDVDPRKWGNRIAGLPVIRPEEIPPPGRCFVLSCVASRGARDEIGAFLETRGYSKGIDYLPAG